ncbi:MAG: molybdopterin-dependent oxidoreductase [Actinobacteria bacterium]|nr:molybdopterin-dependent oxidoreductase [Actinomycetota bacterium]
MLAAAVAVGIGELAAAFVRPEASPIIAVGNRVILLTPEAVRRWAIRQFGTDDKSALLTGIYIGIALLAIVIGLLALRRLALGLAGLAVFGAFGVYSALTAHAHQATDVVPSIVAAAGGMASLWWLTRHWSEGEAAAGRPTEPAAASERVTDRRQFLIGSASMAGVAAATGFGGRALQHERFDASAARAAIALPAPSSPAPALPAGVDLGKGAAPFVTSNKDFYRIDTALSVPQIDPNTWRLRIHGLVDRQITLSYKDILARPLIERWITLACVSNEVGGQLISNARFLGAALADVLREAGVHANADQLVMTSADGMTIGAPTAVVMDGRDSLLAVGMNGVPLPVEHGFPVRVVVPGLYGYVSACKWVVDIRATTFADFGAYWVQQGWVQQAPVVLSSRIDRPSSNQVFAVGETVVFAGVAWEQEVGVDKVEIQIDDGPWVEARLASVPSIDTWRQWVATWTATAGSHTARVRATDAKGRLQISKAAPPYPGAATGYNIIQISAR